MHPVRTPRGPLASSLAALGAFAALASGLGARAPFAFEAIALLALAVLAAGARERIGRGRPLTSLEVALGLATGLALLAAVALGGHGAPLVLPRLHERLMTSLTVLFGAGALLVAAASRLAGPLEASEPRAAPPASRW